jgi:plastocyanin
MSSSPWCPGCGDSSRAKWRNATGGLVVGCAAASNPAAPTAALDAAAGADAAADRVPGESGQDAPGEAQTAAVEQTADVEAGAGKRWEIVCRNFACDPDSLTIAAGDSVRWSRR